MIKTVIPFLILFLTIFVKLLGKRFTGTSPNSVSPIIGRGKALRISAHLGINLISDLGKYLGVPILHKRVNTSSPGDIMEKMSKKLASWTNFLSHAGSVTLIQSVTNSIPNYTVMTPAPPSSLWDKIDKFNRDCLWGDNLGNRKFI